jgi:hypothetical protein
MSARSLKGRTTTVDRFVAQGLGRPIRTWDNLKEQQDMKSRIFLFGMAALCSAPAMAGVIIHDAMRYPPGPTIWAMFVQLFGG